MEKETYTKPEISALEMEPSLMMAGSTLDLGTSDETIDSSEALNNRRRGTWGNLWNKE